MRCVAVFVLLLAPACGSYGPSDNAVAAMNRGLRAMEAERPAEAEEEFCAVLAESPGWIEARINYAVACFHAGVMDGGILDDVPALRPRHAHALFLTGARHRRCGDAVSAVNAFRRLVDVVGGDADAWCWLGLSLKDAGRKSEAVAALTRALSIDGSLRPAKVALAVIRGERADDVSGRPIRGAYAHWGRYARAIRRFPGVDREPGPGENWIEFALEPGPPPETMDGADSGVEVPGVEVRAGRCWFGGVGEGRLELGDCPRVDFVRVVWPSGRLTAHGPYDVNRKIVIRESDS